MGYLVGQSFQYFNTLGSIINTVHLVTDGQKLWPNLSWTSGGGLLE